MPVLAAITPFTALLITFGVATGVAYVLFRRVREVAAPLSDLLVALRPLSIPFLVVLAAATVEFGAIVQLVVAVVLVVGACRLIVVPELAEQREFNAWKRVTFTAIGAVVVVLLFSLDSILSGQSGLAGASLVVGLVALGLAMVVRLVSYATSPLRWPVALLFITATWLGLSWAGIVTSDAGAGTVSVHLYEFVAVAVGVAIAGELLAPRLRPPVPERNRTQVLAGLGLSLATISGILMMIACAASMASLLTSGGDSLPAGDRGALPPGLYADHKNHKIEYVHAPVLAFTDKQPWTPIDVKTYFGLYKAHVEALDKTPVDTRPDHKYRCPPIAGRKCLRVTITCPSADQKCANPIPLRRRGRPDHVSSGLIYARIVPRTPPDPKDKADVVARAALFEPLPESKLPKGPPEGIAHKTKVLLQYWFFYPYDEWTTEFLGATFTQRHEGDWESVSVGLGAGDKPLFVAYSAHCGGSWKPWNKTVRYGTHPLVAVAKGSHGNYSNAGELRPPDFTSCSKLPRGIGTLLAFAANVRDVTDDSWEWGAATVRPVAEGKWPMTFPGTWGYNDFIELKTLRAFRTDQGPGPATPTLQPLWEDPIRTIFCDRYWDHPKGQSCKQALRPGSDNPTQN